jgi:hypothetical protein
MSSVSYQENIARKNMPWQLAKAPVLLLISLGLYQFTNNFPFYTIFEPQSAGWIFWVSYANDLLQPFAFYFFLCLGERWLKTWQVRALIAFATPVLLEFGQLLYQLFYYRFPVAHYFGAFDPLDIVMYTISIGFAVLIERKVLPKFLKNW